MPNHFSLYFFSRLKIIHDVICILRVTRIVSPQTQDFGQGRLSGICLSYEVSVQTAGAGARELAAMMLLCRFQICPIRPGHSAMRHHTWLGHRNWARNDHPSQPEVILVSSFGRQHSLTLRCRNLSALQFVLVFLCLLIIIGAFASDAGKFAGG